MNDNDHVSLPGRDGEGETVGREPAQIGPLPPIARSSYIMAGILIVGASILIFLLTVTA